MADSPWLWVRATGEEIELPVTLDAEIGNAELPVPVTRPEGRDGGVVDDRRVTLAPRPLSLSGRLQFESLEDAYEQVARLGWILSGGVGQLYARDRRDRYIRAVLTRYAPEPEAGGLVWQVNADLIAPDALWLDLQEQVHKTTIMNAAGAEVSLQVGGQWKVWPRIFLSAAGGNVTNPRIGIMGTVRYVQYTGTLTAGQTLDLDPDLLTAKIGNTGVIGSINIGWFDPLDRFHLIPAVVRIRVSAGSIDVGAGLTAELRWRRRWL